MTGDREQGTGNREQGTVFIFVSCFPISPVFVTIP
ncbi:hypothetical protein B6N60_02945 [Richelia sinica FACHB-800]|uniref:Uncharacterized protein n=1 Tax=Richelia sinica FACHB-800 TaxID=1357546 RepID=A0A975Y5H3_9NOST|nr:hypothetical protein B6N60_02945 [Richelia sinica FACHB-800]